MTIETAKPDALVRNTKSRQAHFDRNLPADLVDMLWDRAESLVQRGEPLQSKYIRRTVRLEWSSRLYVLKQYIEPTWQHAVKHSFQPSRAWKTWSATHRLADAGIATPRAVACVENRNGQLWGDTFMMYPYVEGKTLTSYFKEKVRPFSPTHVWGQLHAIWQRLAEIRANLSDTNVRNFIISPRGEIWVIDLDRTRFHRTRIVAAHYRRRAWARLVRSANRVQQRAA